MAALGLHCCARALSSCSEQGLFFVVVCGLLIVVASLVAEQGLQARELQQLWHAGPVVVAHGLSCSAACGIFPDQGSNPCPLHFCRRILNHCATREVPHVFFIRVLQFQLLHLGLWSIFRSFLYMVRGSLTSFFARSYPVIPAACVYKRLFFHH